jgi:hypothetical protein
LNLIICFDLLSIRLSQSYDQSYVFGRLTRVESSCFFIFFYEVISVSWPRSHVWRIYLSYFLIYFFNLILQHWANWRLKFVISFDLLSVELSRSYDPSREFDWLTRVIFLGLFLIGFFSIASFNIELIKNRAS